LQRRLEFSKVLYKIKIIIIIYIANPDIAE
jgi:hypothetical protein